MKPHLEIEYKTLLTHDEYQTLNTHFNFERIIEQTNIYFDADQALFNKKMMCRVRILEGKFKFTLKIPQDEGVLEYEFDMPSLDLNHPKLVSILKPHIGNLKNLKEVGQSHTLRKIYSDDYGEWCLDYNAFSNHNDYELEYELFKPHPLAYDHYLTVIQDLKITYKPADPKYLRSINSKKQPLLK